ncbi:uncharacterized protein UV8b_04555 [Ustilaginoidea virens]|uniref:Uncharacterized protein n=1 Tax=Ustilaginoidea virens TaxID=1159556 RepID=A0A8E5HRI0_USTVR|nr:uncharacterized protein UV8b_04555 [Ustilaginoidea virens]QUC20314.1 hypothetical protein UV8b_04555 [Ustilaginoidea virens]
MKYIAILWTLTSLATADQVFRRTCVDPGGPCWRDSHCCDSDKGYGCMNRRCTLRPGGVCIPAGQRCNPADQTPCCDSDHFNCSVLTRRCAAIPHDHYYQTHKKAQGLQPPTKHQQRDLASLPGVDIAARSEKEDQQGAGPKPRSEKEDSEPRPDKQDEGAGPEQLFPRYCVPYGNSCRADADCCNFHGGVGCHNLQCLWQHGIQCIPLGKSCHPLQKNTCCQPNYHYCDAKTYTCVFREYEQYHDFYQMMQPSSTRRPPIKKKQNREPRDLASLPAEADIAARSEKEDQVAGSKPRSDKEDGGAGPEQLSRRSDDCVAVGDACRLDEHCCDSDKGVGCINRRCTQRSGGCRFHPQMRSDIVEQLSSGSVAAEAEAGFGVGAF